MGSPGRVSSSTWDDPNPDVLSNIFSPEAVQNMSVWIDPEHDVVCGGVMDEGAFGVDEKNIRNPDLFHQTAIESHALIGSARKG